ncbi:MAG: putative peptidoglycan glycosyltransferase FtsW [Pseudomonadota bacterium]
MAASMEMAGARGERAEGEHVDSAWSAWTRTIDQWTLRACLALFAIGVVLSFATSPALALRHPELDAFHFAWRHLQAGGPAFAALIACSFLGPRDVRRVGLVLALLCFVALALLPAYGAGHGKGAVRWFSVMGLSVQPSEFLKPGLIVVCAWMLSGLQSGDRRAALSGAGAAVGVLALALAPLALQPDFGQAALITAVWCVMFFVAGGSPAVLFGVGGVAAALAGLAYAAAPHFARRIDAFLDPAAEGGRQAQIAGDAIASGGWLGRGLAEGQEKATLPDAHSDFILAVAAEEYGFLLVAVILILLTAIPLRALYRLAQVDDPFTRIAGAGLALLIGLQAAVNAGVTAQLLPTTGMTLPFISYGGSSMLAMGISVGLLLALTRRRPRDIARLYGRR